MTRPWTIFLGLMFACAGVGVFGWSLAETPPVAAVQVFALNAHDDSGADPSFAAFRASFMGALKRADWPFLVAASHPLSGLPAQQKKFTGKAQEKKYLTLLTKGLWAGCARVSPPKGVEAEFVCPFVAARWPQGASAESHVAVVRQGVTLRQAPQQGGVVLGHVSPGVYPLCAIKKAGPDASRYGGYACLRTPRFKQGFVFEGKVLGRDELKMVFRKSGGAWRLAGVKP